MKKITLYIFALLSIGYIIGCTQFEEYQSDVVLPKPTATLSVSEVADSSFTLDISTDKAGYLGYVVLSDTAATVPAISILSESLAGAASTVELKTFNLDGAGTTTLSIKGLMPNKYYKVAVAASNADGVESDVQTYIVKTDDGVGPSLSSTSPAKSTDPSQAANFNVVLKFDEPIGTVDASKFTFTYIIDEVDAGADTAYIDPANPFQVIVTQSRVAHAGEYVSLSYDDGAVEDLSGNPVAAKISGVNGGSLVGLYWRVENVDWDIDVATVVPEIGSAVSNLGFSVQFKTPFPVTNNADDGSVRFIVTSTGKTTIYDVPATDIVVNSADSTVIINKPFAPNYGDMVYLEMDEGTLLDDYDNPNTVIESGVDGIANEGDPVTVVSWFISYGYTRDMILGTYTFSGVSYWAGSDESFDVEIVADPADESKVIINGFYGSQTPIPATFDGDFATLTVSTESDYLLGDLFNDGGETSFWSYQETQFVLNISPNGDMVTDPNYWLALYWVSADGNDEGWVNLFTESTWTKQGAAATSSSKLKSSSILQIRRGIPKDGIVKK